MARIRSIKPEYFRNEVLASLDKLSRILFPGLWCIADREGRLEYRPQRIKAEILPYDECEIEKLLAELEEAKLILKYEANGEVYIQVINFVKHQRPHSSEPPSVIPPPETVKKSNRTAENFNRPVKKIRRTAEIFNPRARARRGEERNGREGNGRERRGEGGHEGETSPKAPAQLPSALSNSFLDDLQAKPIYQGIEVRQVYAKLQVWCQVKGKEPTAERLINWLNREEPPGKHRGSGVQQDGNGTSSDKTKIERVVKRIIANRELDKAKSRDS